MVSLALTSNNSEMIKVGLETMSHFIRIFREECKEFNQNFIEYVCVQLKDPNFFPELKSALFIGLGDAALGSPSIFIQVVPQVLDLYKMGYEACKVYLTNVRLIAYFLPSFYLVHLRMSDVHSIPT